MIIARVVFNNEKVRKQKVLLCIIKETKRGFYMQEENSKVVEVKLKIRCLLDRPM